MKRGLFALGCAVAALVPNHAEAACEALPPVPDVCPEPDVALFTPGSLLHWPVAKFVDAADCIGDELFGIWNGFGDTNQNSRVHSGLDIRTRRIVTADGPEKGRSDLLLAPTNVDLWVPWDGSTNPGKKFQNDICTDNVSCRYFLRNRGNNR